MNVDGMKTGHTETAGYGLTASAERNGRRLVLVVNGLPSMQARADESARIWNGASASSKSYALFKKGEPVDQAAVWLGAANTVPLVVEDDLRVTMNRDERRNLKVSVVLDGAGAGTVAKGTKLGKIVMEAPGFSKREVPLVAGQDVERLGFIGRIGAAAMHLVSGRVADR